LSIISISILISILELFYLSLSTCVTKYHINQCDNLLNKLDLSYKVIDKIKIGNDQFDEVGSEDSGLLFNCKMDHNSSLEKGSIQVIACQQIFLL